MRGQELLQNFVRGENRRLIELPLAVFERAGRIEFLISALIMSGDLERALALGTKHEPKDKSGLTSFYLSLGLTRAGRYGESFERIARLQQLGSTGLLPFWTAQARGFYLFNIGDNEGAIASARAALVAAESSQDRLQPLARILSLDLLGHSLIRIGQNRRGIKTLKLAREAAIQARHENFNHAISISLLKYEALFGLEPTRVLSRLYRALVELKPNDSHSRSELRLELARQLILRGQLREARRHLEDAAAEVLGSQNRLQTASLHLRLAWMARLEGRPLDALLGLQSAETGVGPSSENNTELLRKIEFFRLDLYRQLGRDREAQQLESKLAQTKAPLNGIETRLYNRRTQIDSTALRDSMTEDPFGDLMDRVATRAPKVMPELLDSGYFGLLLPLMGIQLGHTAIVLGAPGGRVIVVDDGEARIARSGLKGLLGKLLARLADGPCTKREAIEAVWGYSYDSERHDRLLLVAISRIRKTLGGEPRWLELQGDRIVLREQVGIRFWANAAPSTRGRPPELPPVAIKRGLRIRQLQVLDDLATRGDVGVQDLVQRFGISRASALRDLNELVEAGLILRAGETRATRYLRA